MLYLMTRKYVKKKKAHISPWTKEKIRRKNLEYKLTPNGKKRQKLANWRSGGMRFGKKNYMFDIIYEDFIKQTHCECCGKPFSTEMDKTLDHDHNTDEDYNIRGIICRSCNLRREDLNINNNTGIRNVYKIYNYGYPVYYVWFNVCNETVYMNTFNNLDDAILCRNNYVKMNPWVYT